MLWLINKMRSWKILFLCVGILLWTHIPSGAADGFGAADTLQSFDHNLSSDTLAGTRFIHRAELETRPGYIVPTNSFLRGENATDQPIRHSLAMHLKYSFQFYPGSYRDYIYGGAYQGVGLAFYSLGEHKQLGEPVVFYLFQGARISRFTSRLSFNYEWNFGLSCNWKPYDPDDNSYNKMIGSKVNAYINVNFYLDWILSRHFHLTSGIALTHFSNGNTRFPNAGLNTVGLKVGVVYNFNGQEYSFAQPSCRSLILAYSRHINYDLVFFGSWRRKGVSLGEEEIASPEAYAVAGFNFIPMYNLGYKFRVGVSLDGVYDGSANVYAKDYIVGTQPEFYKPAFYKQLALGLSGRAEYVMPYFTVGVGMGANVLHAGGDLNGFYQILALKIETTRNTFLHIGYNLKDFQDPNFLMLGFGIRFDSRGRRH